MTMGRLTSNLAAALVGSVVGAVIVLAAEGVTRDLGATPPDVASVAPSPSFEVGAFEVGILKRRVDPRRTVLLAWAPGGLPARAERVVQAMPEVQSATTVKAGLDWIESSRALDGSRLDVVPKGFGIPFEVAVIQPGEYAAYVPPSERDAVLGLVPGQGLLAQSESELRGAGAGAVLRLEGERVAITGVVSDVATQGYEGLIAGPVPRTWQRTDRFVLMRVHDRSARGAIAARLEKLLRPDQALRIRAQGETPFLRYGDAVLPQLHIKSAFGEFAAKPRPDGTIEVQRSWRAQNIASKRVPILGTITCHRAIFPQLRHALQQVVGAGLAFAVDPGDFGGCYSPRFINRNPGGRLSHHSWGIGIDINVRENRPGTRPDQDRRLVRIMEDNGFTWGGRWLIPDGMHFEWVRFP